MSRSHDMRTYAQVAAQPAPQAPVSRTTPSPSGAQLGEDMQGLLQTPLLDPTPPSTTLSPTLEDVKSGNEFMCAPCNRSFTTRRALVRHAKGTKRHRTDDDRSIRSYKCRLCAVTTTRPEDLRRHEHKQHTDEMSTCLACGIQSKPGTHPEKKCPAWLRNLNAAAVIADDVRGIINCASVVGNELEIDWSFWRSLLEHSSDYFLLPSQSGDEESATESGGDSEQACQMLTTPHEDRADSNLPQTTTQLKHEQIVAKSSLEIESRPFCGHCHNQFERKRKDIAQHLDRHLRELSQQHTCPICDIAFVREDDLTYHEHNSGSSFCGFKFAHILECTGHHPIDCLDRGEYVARIRHWEQSQLQLFGRSVEAVLLILRVSDNQRKGSQARLSGHTQGHPSNTYSPRAFPSDRSTYSARTAPAHVDYNARIGPMLAQFKRLDMTTSSVDSPLTFPTKALNPNFATRNDSFHPVEATSRSTRLLNSVSNLQHTRPLSPAPPVHGAGDISAFARYLLDASRDRHGSSLLHRFSTSNNIPALALLLSAGLDPDDQYALRYQTFLEGNPDVDERDAPTSPLQLAVAKGSLEAVTMLLRHGARVNVTDISGRTPLHLALINDHHDVALALIAHGADINARENYSGETPLHYAAQNQERIVTAKVLLFKGADLNAKTQGSGSTPLHVAASNHHDRMANLFLEYGANADTKDSMGETPSDVWCSTRGKEEQYVEGGKLVKRFLQHPSPYVAALSRRLRTRRYR